MTRWSSEEKHCPFLGRFRKRDKADSEEKKCDRFFILRHVYDSPSGTGQIERSKFRHAKESLLSTSAETDECTTTR